MDKGTDKEKVKQLKFLLSLPSEDNQEEEKDLLSEEGNTKLPVIIDDDNWFSFYACDLYDPWSFL